MMISSNLPTSKPNEKLFIKEKAELKIRAAISYAQNVEISWFGIIEKVEDGYILKNILFPPQINQSAHVETKDDEYPQWYFENIIKKGLAETIRLHGHTHPNFSTTPSGIDVLQFKGLMEQTDNYMIQMILNNDLGYTCYLHVKGDPVLKPLDIVFLYSKKLENVLKKMINKKQIVYEVPKYLDYYNQYYKAYTKKTNVQYNFIVSDPKPQEPEIPRGLGDGYNTFAEAVKAAKSWIERGFKEQKVWKKFPQGNYKILWEGKKNESNKTP